MAYRDIDYSIRVNGDINVPDSSIFVGSNTKIHSNRIEAQVLSGNLEGDGSKITNLSSAAMPDVLLLNGQRWMTGNLVVSKENPSLVLKTTINKPNAGSVELLETGNSFSDTIANGFQMHYSGTGNNLTINSKYSDITYKHIDIVRGGSTSINYGLKVDGNINVTGNVDGVLVSKLKTDFDSHNHDDRYYTETEVDGRITDLSGYLKTYVQSRGETVVTNGLGLMGDNTNFSQFTFDSSQVYAGKGSFYTDKQSGFLTNDELIPVNPNKEYKLEVMAKSYPYTGANTFIGLIPYDVDGYTNSPYNYYVSRNPTLKLTKELKKGDTVIYLDKTDGLRDDVETPDHFHSLGFYGYKNSFGYVYPAGTYTRDTLTVAWNKGAIDRTNNTITLKEPFKKTNPNDPDGIYRVGHELAATQSGSSYLYTAASGAIIPEDWTPYSGTISGIGIASNKFPPGTAAVKLMFLVNRASAGSGTYFNSISFALDVETISEVRAEIEDNVKGYTYSKSDSDLRYEPKGTLHDDRYYTETEMNTKLAAKSNTGHTHTFASLTGKPTTLSGYGITAEYQTAQQAETAYGDKIKTLTENLDTAEKVIQVLGETDGTLQNQLDEARAELEGLEVGGRNLLLNSKTFWTSAGRVYDKAESRHETYAYYTDRLSEDIFGKIGTYTLSVSVKSKTQNSNTDFEMGTNTRGSTGGVNWSNFASFKDTNEKWIRVSATIKITDIAHDKILVAFYGNNVISGDYWEIKNDWKLERGTKATDWTPAPEDTEQKITTLNEQIQLVLEKVNGHVEDSKIHRDWGNWDTNGADILRGRGKNVIYAPSSGMISMNHTKQFDGVDISGNLRVDSHTAWHAGNLTPADYIGKGNNQRVGNGFGVNGRLLVGNVSGQSGDVVVYNGSGAPTIHLDGDASGIENLTNTKVHIDGLGNANFRETVTVKNLTSLNHTKTETLETERINNVRTVNYAKNQSVIDTGGWGIHSALDAIAYGGELHVNPGIAFTNTGMRVEVLAREKVVMTPVSTSGDRYDVVYIKGSSAGIEEGKLGYFEGNVGGTEAAVLSSGGLSDAVILATVHRKRSQASISQANINNDARTNDGITGVKPLIVEPDNRNVLARYEMHASRYKEDGKYINTIYSTLAGGNTFTSNQTFNGRVSIISTGALAGNSSSSNYSLRVGTSSHQMRIDGKDILGNSDINLVANNNLTLKGQNLNLDGKVSVPSQASTVSVPAGQTSVTWTHNYGSTSYAVNFTTNSFERHIKWSNKTANSITVEIDDPTDKVVLVDCILIGY